MKTTLVVGEIDLMIPPETADTPEGVFEMLLVLVTAEVVGFGAIIFAALLARRVARRQKAWLETKRLPAAHWRDVWAECLIGIGFSFVGLTLVIAGGSATRPIGCGVVVLAVATAWHCGKSLNEAAKVRHQAATLPPGVSSHS